MQLYSQLADRRTHPIGAGKWSGNQRWYAVEADTPLAYLFQTFPIGEQEGELDDPASEGLRHGRRSLFSLAHAGMPEVRSVTYLPDGLVAQTEHGTFRLLFPWGMYGALMEWEVTAGQVEIAIEHALQRGRHREQRRPITITASRDYCDLSDGVYAIALRFQAVESVRSTENGITVLIGAGRRARCAVAFHTSPVRAAHDASRLLALFDVTVEHSAQFWEAYLQSCPIQRFDHDYTYVDVYTGNTVTIPRQTLLVRQLWHWWVALINVADVEFNESTPYLAPDRAHWHGSWSNDSPEAMCALALTNQRDLVRRCIVRYVAGAIDAAGELGWYTHSYGRSCLGHEHDSGFYSHGVPTIVHTVEFYIRHTGDISILEALAGDGMTVWDKLARYIERLFAVRDGDGDGLIEWRNLWETGWDNKVGPFFSRSSVEEWAATVSRNDRTEVAAWYAAKCFPVVALAEQVHLLSALAAMAHLAGRRGDEALATACRRRYAHIQAVVEQRHWSEASTFYHDWDVRNGRLVEAKHLDAVYYLYHCADGQRAASVIARLADPSTFGLPLPPTLGTDHPRFEPTGYWNGSYWPREMLYVALALHQHGCSDLALREVVKALCSQAGCIVAETLHPFTSEPNSQVYSMAYSACLNIALCELRQGSVWLVPNQVAAPRVSAAEG